MGPALLIITVGGMLTYSAFAGVGITDIFNGVKGTKLNPKGPSFGGGGNFTTTDTTGVDPTSIKGPTGGFKGKKAALLEQLMNDAGSKFGLSITSTDGGVHVPGSYHYLKEAFDASGNEADMHAFAQYVHDNYGPQITELIHNPGFAMKNGRDVNPALYAAVWAEHKNHVHVAAA